MFKFLWLFLVVTAFPAIFSTTVLFTISDTLRKPRPRNLEFFIIASLMALLAYEAMLLIRAHEFKSQLAHLINFVLALSSGLIALVLKYIISKHFPPKNSP